LNPPREKEVYHHGGVSRTANMATSRFILTKMLTSCPSFVKRWKVKCWKVRGRVSYLVSRKERGYHLKATLTTKPEVPLIDYGIE